MKAPAELETIGNRLQTFVYARHPDPDSQTILIALHELKMASSKSQPARNPNFVYHDISSQTKEDQLFRTVKALRLSNFVDKQL